MCPIMCLPTHTFGTMPGDSLDGVNRRNRPESLHQLTRYYSGLFGQIGAVHNYELGGRRFESCRASHAFQGLSGPGSSADVKLCSILSPLHQVLWPYVFSYGDC